MTANTATCVTIACDACGTDLEIDGITMHAATIAEHRDFANAEDWFIAADGRALCRSSRADHGALADRWRPGLDGEDRDRLGEQRGEPDEDEGVLPVETAGSAL